MLWVALLLGFSSRESVRICELGTLISIREYITHDEPSASATLNKAGGRSGAHSGQRFWFLWLMA